MKVAFIFNKTQNLDSDKLCQLYVLKNFVVKDL